MAAQKITIAGEDYWRCDGASKNYWSSSKTGLYGSGILNNDGDPRKTERIGLLGELAVARLLGVVVDFRYKEYGDAGYDLVSKRGNRIAVKTASRDYGVGLVRCVDGNGDPISLEADIYVFAYIAFENRQNGVADVIVVGWAYRSDVEQCRIRPGRVARAKWRNYEVDYKTLKTFGDV